MKHLSYFFGVCLLSLHSFALETDHCMEFAGAGEIRVCIPNTDLLYADYMAGDACAQSLVNDLKQVANSQAYQDAVKQWPAGTPYLELSIYNDNHDPRSAFLELHYVNNTMTDIGHFEEPRCNLDQRKIIEMAQNAKEFVAKLEGRRVEANRRQLKGCDYDNYVYGYSGCEGDGPKWLEWFGKFIVH
jgi:hypothetical protein